jgi:RND superfamily putative drug exporter
MLVAGAPAFYRDIEEVSQRDLRRAELIAFPIALAALLFVFRSGVAALVPLATGAAGVGAVLLTLYVVAQRVDISIFALNLATMLGLGLAVDYALFVTSRYREGAGEHAGRRGRGGRADGRDRRQGGLLLRPDGADRAVGLVFFDILFPPLGRRRRRHRRPLVDPGGVDAAAGRARRHRQPDRPPSRSGGLPRTTARRLLGRSRPLGDGPPWRTLAPTLALLSCSERPSSTPTSRRRTRRSSRASCRRGERSTSWSRSTGAGEISPFLVVARSPRPCSRKRTWPRCTTSRSGWRPTPGSLGSSRLPRRRWSETRRSRSSGCSKVWTGSASIPASAGWRRTIAAVVLAYSRFLPNDERNKELLREIRDDSTGGDLELLVDGGTAEIVDVVQAIYDQFPAVAATIVGATYLVLLLLFRSLLLPLKAIAMNTLSIFASYGALVWIFQDGNLSGLLGFDPQGFVEASLPVIMFCVLFGLSMDYEVFLLSRIREEWERTHDNTRAVTVGMQRSGRIITSAALLVVVVTASFVSADVVLIKALGFGIALAVLLDATIIRALVVPATMRLLGEWNWWLPKPVARLLPAPSLVEESA